MTASQMSEIFDHTCPECGRISPTKGGLGVHRRQVHGVVGPKSKNPSKNPHDLAVALYEALVGHADAERRVMISLPKLCGIDAQLKKLFTGPQGAISSSLLRDTLHYLINHGSVRMNGNRVKHLIAHPDDIEPGESHLRESHQSGVSAINGSNGRASNKLSRLPNAKVDLMDTIDQVPPEVLADSIARKMWERYEWALSELGKMHAALEVKDAELHRLRLQLEEREPVNMKDAARLILS